MEQKMSEITLTTEQIFNLCKFVGIEVDEAKTVFHEDDDQRETPYKIAQNEHGAVAWLEEYPEEGGFPLNSHHTMKECRLCGEDPEPGTDLCRLCKSTEEDLEAVVERFRGEHTTITQIQRYMRWGYNRSSRNLEKAIERGYADIVDGKGGALFRDINSIKSAFTTE